MSEDKKIKVLGPDAKSLIGGVVIGDETYQAEPLKNEDIKGEKNGS
jgi:hypothetical protein